MKGSVKVSKVFSDGTKELVCQDDNVLTDAIGYSIINILSDTGSRNIQDHLVGYFQVGIGRLNPDLQPNDKRKYISTLKTPLSEASYGKNVELEINKHPLQKLHKSNFNPALGEEIENSNFAILPDANSTKLIDGVVHYRLSIGEEAANGLNISEFGLFVRNPDGATNTENSILIAYKNFPVDETITKNSNFSLEIDWQIKFVDEINTEIEPASSTPVNIVFIMIDDVGFDYLGIYDDINPYDLSCTGSFTADSLPNPNANPFSQLDDVVDGCGIYPHTPCLSGLAASGMVFRNTRAMPTCSPTRACVITGKYNFSCKNSNQGDVAPGPGIWGPGIGSVTSPVGVRSRGGVKGLNRSYTLLPAPGEGAPKPFEYLCRGAQDEENKIAKQKVFAEYMRDRGFGSSFFGKWHLAHWLEEVVYCEDGADTVYGEGWNNIGDVGKWDHYVSTWANLRGGTPVPGKKFDGAWQAGGGGPLDGDGNLILGQCWPNFGMQPADAYYLRGDEMGYVNFFSVSGNNNPDNIDSYIVETVSDVGYVPPALSASSSPVTYSQGSPANFATTHIFEKAKQHFGSSAINPEPFMQYLAPNLPHDPWTFPPEEGVYNPYYKANHIQILLQDGNPILHNNTEGATSSSWITVNAQLEHFDYVLSSFMDSLDKDIKDRTIFIITSDNGSVNSDIGKRANFCTSTVGSNYLGLTFSSMLNLDLHCSAQWENDLVGSVQPVRRGGQNNSANQFKSSLYETGTRVPMIAYGPSAGVLSGVTSDAFIDLVDVLATVVDGASHTQKLRGHDIPSDSISFLDVLTGETNASSHPRQFSFGEDFFPVGNSFGNPDDAGSNSGQALQCEGGTGVGLGDPTTPKKRRSCMLVRHAAADYASRPAPLIAPEVFAQLGFTGTYAGDGNSDPEGIPAASGGTWKIVRPTGYPVIVDGVQVDFLKGSLYDELYHIQKEDFSYVDLFELYDYIPEEWKGEKPVGQPGEVGPLIVSGLIASAVNVVGSTGHLDNTTHYWNLARIYDVLRTELSYFLEYRRDPSTSVLSVDSANYTLDLDET